MFESPSFSIEQTLLVPGCRLGQGQRENEAVACLMKVPWLMEKRGMKQPKHRRELAQGYWEKILATDLVTAMAQRLRE